MLSLCFYQQNNRLNLNRIWDHRNNLVMRTEKPANLWYLNIKYMNYIENLISIHENTSHHPKPRRNKTSFIHVKNFQVPKGKNTWLLLLLASRDSWLPTQIFFSLPTRTLVSFRGARYQIKMLPFLVSFVKKDGHIASYSK